MPHFNYEGTYIGFLWRMWADPRDLYGPIRMMGKIDCELTYSINGVAWNRTNRQSFLPNPDLGWGSQYPTSLIADDQGWLRIYTAACLGEHADGGKLPKGAPNVHLTISRLRVDGFCALESRTGVGSFSTRAFIGHGGPITINALAGPCGSVRVELRGLDDAAIPGYELANCVPITGDQRQARLRWVKDGQTLDQTDALKGKFVRVFVALDEARIYAIRLAGDYLFGCIPATDLAGHFLPNQIY
jgi:hypothetical protein